MAKPHEKLAASLKILSKLQEGGRCVYRSSELTRTHRERLIKSGFLNEVIKGWLIQSRPGVVPGDTTAWFTSFWQFCAIYCSDRFGVAWCLSPEQSLLFGAENTAIPKQVTIHASKGNNRTIDLPYGTSLFVIKSKKMPKITEVGVRDGIRFILPEVALLKVSARFFAKHPAEAMTILSGIRQSTDLLIRLLDGGHTMIAGRICGALRSVGKGGIADEILQDMKMFNYDVRETNPLPSKMVVKMDPELPPIVSRMCSQWHQFRDAVLAVFPKTPGLPEDTDSYMASVFDNYKSDAYHSLSIEGYHVTQELQERIQSGQWRPDQNESDKNDRNALAAYGYWLAFQHVQEAVRRVLNGENPGKLLDRVHQSWYKAMFLPSVQARLLLETDLIGYRSIQVYISGSRHVPPRWEVVRDAMPALFSLLENESETSVRAVLGHWMFGQVHPYVDGNGRMARFLMNVMLASGGFPWTTIKVDDRNRYMSALETASVDGDIGPFARFIAEQVELTMRQ